MFLTTSSRCQRVLGAVLASLAFAVPALAREEAMICRYCQQSGQAQQSQLAEPTEGTQRKYAPAREVDVLHVKIDVIPDFRRRTVQGTTTIRFVPIVKPLQELRLDAVNQSISDVRSSEKVSDYVTTQNDLTIVFDPPIPVGHESSVEIDHRAEPKQGFYFRTKELGYDERDEHVWTQGEPHEARHWFPCYDYPNEKSSTEVVCHLPQEMTALANGRLVSESVDEKTGLKAVTWLQDKPHATYLVCLVAGKLAHLEKKHRDVSLRFYTQPTLLEHADNAFADTEKIMAFFEEEIGIPFPWDKYDQATIMDFMWGGMENTSLTTLTDHCIFPDATENVRSNHGLDSHEMAHQWFGDYVTCKDWSHLWLNEGFATYYSHLYTGKKLGRDDLLYGLYQDARHAIFSAADDKRPIVYKEYQGPWEQFDFRAYPKGSWVLHMLRNQLGEDVYRRCIKTYLERFAYQSVDTEDLREVCENVSGQGLDRFFDQWVYHARFPDLKVQYRWLPQEKLAEVTVEQTQEVNDDVLLFQFPTRLRFHLEDDPRSYVDHEIEIKNRREVFHIPLPKQPRIVRLDPELTVLARVDFPRTDAMLLAQLDNPLDVIGRLQAIEELAKRKSGEAVAALRKRLQEDSFHGVREEASRALRRIDSDEAYAALADSVEQEDARVRLQVVSDLASTYRPEALKALFQVVDSEKNPAIVAAAIRGLGKFNQDETRKRLVQLLRQPSFRNEVASAAVDAIRDQDDSSMVPVLLELLRKEGSTWETRDVANLLETVGQLSRGEGEKQAIRESLAEYLRHPKERIRIGAIQGLGHLRDHGAAAILRSLISQDEGDRISRAAREAVTRLDSQADFVPEEVRELRKSIKELQGDVDRLKESPEPRRRGAPPRDRGPRDEKRRSRSRATPV